MHLSPKENYLRAVRFQEAEYVPNGRCLPVEQVGYFGVNPEDNRPEGSAAWQDFWGVGHEQELEGVMPFPKHHPMPDPDKWDEYRWPDPATLERMHSPLAKATAVDRENLLLAVSHRSTLFERAWKLVGMENLLVSMAADPDRAEWLFDQILAFQTGVARQYLDRLHPDMASLGDDLGTQRGLIFSVAHFRRFLKPRYARLIAMYKERGVLVWFHSCGHIMPLVADFMELGIDILNPVQARANEDLPLLRRQTAGCMALHGGVDTQYTLTLGTADEVRAEVHERIRTLGRDGGYICAPDQHMPLPAANVSAFDEAVAAYGQHPIV